MIINSAPQNEAIMSNVGQIGEFRIRNSAKAFNILSSGLYANKIRAIIRELSCNAVDSHVAAGKQDTPFDVHMPNSLEPWFSIRDYGTGLSADQVTNIYTTYFESTKTDSNDYVGALGLGSKSPFSYTDNFTVTAIKDGIKGVYTAFINEAGVPSIAKMMEEQTTDPAGVEVKFAVEERYDFDKFRQEAKYVYEYFTLRPVVSGNSDFKFKDPEHKEENIIPGVHYRNDSNRSYAIMGHIKYPIDIPNADKSLDGLHGLLGCGLVMEFNIGELDFQASREGLSYIPQTIVAIKTKLQALNSQLAVHIAQEADKIDNLWERALYLYKRHSESLFTQAVAKYCNDTKFELFSPQNNRWGALKQFKFDVLALASRYNIAIKSFTKNSNYAGCSTNKTASSYGTSTAVNPVVTQEWQIRVSDDVYFVINDTKVGATERAKFHWKNAKSKTHTNTVYVIEAAVKDKPVKTDEFFKELMSPPEGQIFKASDLLEKERKSGIGANVTIMHLTEGARRGSWSNSAPMVWHDAGKANSFDATTTYYYLPLSGYQNLGLYSNVKDLHFHLQKSGLFTDTIYGVRKTDIEWVKAQKNWVNLDEHIQGKLGKLGQNDVMGLVKQSIGWKELYKFGASNIIKDASSPYMVLYNTFKDVKAEDKSRKSSLEALCRNYKVQTQSNIDPSSLVDKYNKEVADVYTRYPLLKGISEYSTTAKAIADYITMVDKFNPA